MLFLWMTMACTSSTQVWFSPDADLTKTIVDEMGAAAETLDVAVYTFTEEEIRDALIDATTRGVKVRLAIDVWEANDEIADSLGDSAVSMRRTAGFDQSAPESKLHHKFAIIDEESILTGSFNYTRSANFANHENLMLIRDRALAGQFTSAFNDIWAQADAQ